MLPLPGGKLRVTIAPSRSTLAASGPSWPEIAADSSTGNLPLSMPATMYSDSMSIGPRVTWVGSWICSEPLPSKRTPASGANANWIAKPDSRCTPDSSVLMNPSPCEVSMTTLPPVIAPCAAGPPVALPPPLSQVSCSPPPRVTEDSCSREPPVSPSRIIGSGGCAASARSVLAEIWPLGGARSIVNGGRMEPLARAMIATWLVIVTSQVGGDNGNVLVWSA